MSKNKSKKESKNILDVSNKRNIKETYAKIVSVWCVFGVLLHLYSIFIAFLTPQVHMAIHLLFPLSLVFIVYKPRASLPSETAEKIPFYDVLLSALSVCVTVYIIINWQGILTRVTRPTFIDLLFSVLTVLLILEGTRRVMGMVMPIIAFIFLAYAKFGYVLPSVLGHRGASFERLMSLQYMTTEGIWGTPTQVSSKMIFMFTLFGSFLFVSGAGEKLMKISFAFAGKYSGGPAKVAVVSSGLMGMVSGSASSNVATTGQFTIPMMKQMGFKPQLAGAIEAVASTGGTLAPPVMGAGAFIMAEILGISYLTIVKAAVVPAVLYYLCCFIVVHFEAKKLGMTGLAKSELPSKKESLKGSSLIIVPVTVLMYLVFTHFPIMKAALYAVFAILIMAFLKKETRLSIRKIFKAMEDCMMNMITLALCCSAAGIVVGCVAITGLGPKIASALILVAGDKTWIALIIGMIVTIILGMGLPATAAYVVGASVVAPALLKLGYYPLAAQMFVFYFSCLAQITPPIALASYVGAAIAGSNPMKTAVTSMRLGLVALVIPFMFVSNQSLLWVGETKDIITNSSIALLGAVACAIGLAGYFRKKMNIPIRIICVIGGLLVINPGYASDLIGAALVAIALFANSLPIKKKGEKINGPSVLIDDKPYENENNKALQSKEENGDESEI